MQYFYRFVYAEGPGMYEGDPNPHTGNYSICGHAIAFASKSDRDNATKGFPLTLGELRGFCAGMTSDEFAGYIERLQMEAKGQSMDKQQKMVQAVLLEIKGRKKEGPRNENTNRIHRLVLEGYILGLKHFAGLNETNYNSLQGVILKEF